ncbi:MAG: major capsid protein [Microviridae sp.]|nr:MAG: major capsid protein [Microviridae sp.]
MARQSTTPVAFNRSTRTDTSVLMSSGRAGQVCPVGYIPLLAGDSCSGRIGVDFDMAEMPKPLLNGVILNLQAWFIPKSSQPQFSGYDEFLAAFQGHQIKQLGAADRNAPAFFSKIFDTPDVATLNSSAFFNTLGLHVPVATKTQSDLIDAFALVHNFRLASHSSKLARVKYAAENVAEALSLKRAFWGSGRFSRVVPDYEKALVMGSLDLDVTAGQVPISGLWAEHAVVTKSNQLLEKGGETLSAAYNHTFSPLYAHRSTATGGSGLLEKINAEMAGMTIGTSLADIDRARDTQAFAKVRASYAGNDSTGFDNDDAITAHLMQGLSVPADQFKRPWLLDSVRQGFGFTQRHATDAANLDQSVSVGRASATLSLNVPQNDVGGLIIILAEILPERLDERQSDEWLHITDHNEYPNALRDVLRTNPVDVVQNRRLDARHATPLGLYGYEPMNDKYNRSTTRLGGKFYQADPTNPFKEARSAIWQTSVINPSYTADHFLAPENFPHSVFSDTLAPAFEFTARHNVSIVGLTQIGDVLYEDNNDYQPTQEGN